MLSPKEIYDYIDHLYEGNAFVQLCGIKTHSISCGRAAVGLRLDLAKHTNLNASIHGGLLMAIMDNATGIACAAMGKRVVTVSMTVDFIKGAPSGAMVEAQAEVVSHNDRLITMQIHVYDTDADTLLATGSCCMLTIADFPGIPEKW